MASGRRSAQSNKDPKPNNTVSTSQFSTSTPIPDRQNRFRPSNSIKLPTIRNPPRLLSPTSAAKKVKKSNVKASKRFVQYMIPRLCFARIVRDVAREVSMSELRWNGLALAALQEATEAFLTNLLEDAYLVTLHSKRVTLMVHDIQMVRRIQRLQL